MSRDKTLYLIFLYLPFLFCSKGVPIGTDYFPLRVGQREVYNYLGLDWDEGEVDTLETGRLEFFIGQKDSSAGMNRYQLLVKVTSESDTILDTLYWEESEEYIAQYDSLGAKPDTFLLLPLEKGKSWRLSSFWLFLIREEPRYYYATNEGKDSVRVGGEKFSNTQRIKYWGEEGIEGVFYLAKDIGLVKWIDREGEVDSYTEYIFEWKREE